MSKSETPSVQQLKRALELAEEITRLEAELASVLANGDTSRGTTRAVTSKTSTVKSVSAPIKTGGRRPLSEEARERIAAAQRRRWAKAKGSSGAGKATASAAKVSSTSSASTKGKRVLSPEGRARIAEAARRRWAAHRKAR